MPAASIDISTLPSALFDVPIMRAGSKASPSIGHSSPVLRPVTGCKGNSDTTSPAAISIENAGGASTITSCAPSKTQGRSACTKSV